MSNAPSFHHIKLLWIINMLKESKYNHIFRFLTRESANLHIYWENKWQGTYLTRDTIRAGVLKEFALS